MKKMLILMFVALMFAACAPRAQGVFIIVPTPIPEPTCTQSGYLSQIGSLPAEWDDAMRIANATGRGYLAGPVAELQRIHRATGVLSVSPCYSDVQGLLLTSQDDYLEGFLAFMSDAPDTTVNRWFDDGDRAAESLGTALNRLPIE